MWFRGILPSKFTDLDIPEPVNELHVTHIQQQNAHWKSGTYYGDASGGECSQYNALRRVGVGFLLANQEGGLVHGAHFNLPGIVQTVTRGELFALVVLLRFLEPLSIVEFITDNYNVLRTFNGGPAAGVNSANCDLYGEVFQIIYDKAIKINVRWIPSHIKEKLDSGELQALPEGVSMRDVLANDNADQLAAKAAEEFKLPINITTPYIFQVKRIKKIQVRLTTIGLYLPQRDKRKEDKEPKVTINKDNALAETSHNIIQVNNRYKCTVCLNSFRRDDKGFKHWLITQCVKPSNESIISLHTPVKVNTHIHLGNSTVHTSHNMYDYRGIMYCNVCGARTGMDQMRYLSKQCQPPGPGGKALLLAIAKNKLPAGLKEWPRE